MGFIRDCCGSRRALGPQPCLEEQVAQCWLGDASVRMGLEHHGESALGPPGSPCPQPVPAALQGLGRRVPARGVPADHPPPGLDGTAVQRPPWLTRFCRVAGGGCGTPGRRARAGRHQLLVGIPQECGWWAHGKDGLHWGIQTPEGGTGLRYDGREPRTTGTLTTSPTCWPHTPVPPGTPPGLPGLCPGDISLFPQSWQRWGCQWPWIILSHWDQL